MAEKSNPATSAAAMPVAPGAESSGSGKISSALAARIIAARKILDAQNKAEGGSGSTGSGGVPPPIQIGSGAGASSSSGAGSRATATANAAQLPAYVPRSQQYANSAPLELPLAASVLPVGIGLLTGCMIGVLTSWFHPSQSKLVSLAGAPFILYFCFKTSAMTSTGDVLSPERYRALINDPNSTPQQRRKATADQFSAMAEQYSKYGLAVGFMLAIGWEFVDTAGVRVWWSVNGTAVVDGLIRFFSSPSVLSYAFLGVAVGFVLYRRRQAAAAYLQTKFEVAPPPSASVDGANHASAASADRDATTGAAAAAPTGASIRRKKHK